MENMLQRVDHTVQIWNIISISTAICKKLNEDETQDVVLRNSETFQ